MIVVNLIAGPGAGKSTTAAGLFGLMKMRHLKVELVQEFAKDKTYEKDWSTLSNQFMCAAQQDQRLRRLLGQVDWCINDSALPLGLAYAVPPFDQDWFTRAVWGLYDTYENFNVFIRRVKPYQQYGRAHSEAESQEKDDQLRSIFEGRIDLEVDGDDAAPAVIFEALKRLSPGTCSAT